MSASGLAQLERPSAVVLEGKSNEEDGMEYRHIRKLSKAITPALICLAIPHKQDTSERALSSSKVSVPSC